MNLFGPPNITKLSEKHDVKGLVNALTHKDPSIQYDAIRAMDNLKDNEFVQPLLKIAVQNNRNSANAFRALRSIKDSRIVAPLLQLLNELRKQSQFNSIADKYYDIHLNIIETLADFQDTHVMQEMIEILKSDYRLNFIELAESSLIKSGDNSIFPLVQVLPYANDKERIIKLLSKIGTSLAIFQLELLVENSDKIIRESAAKSLKLSNIKPRRQRQFIYYSIAIKDFNSVFEAGEIAIPFLKNSLKDELDFIKKKEPYLKDEWWETLTYISCTLLKLGVTSLELKNVLNDALYRSKKTDIRRIIINNINGLGQDYEHILISYVDSYLNRINDKEIDAGLLLGFPNHIYLKLFSSDNKLISKTQYICVLSHFDAYNTSNDMIERIINAKYLLLEISNPLIEYVKDKIEQKWEFSRLSQEFDTLLHISRLDKKICAEEQNLMELINKEKINIRQ